MGIADPIFLYLFLPLCVGLYYLMPAKKSLTARNTLLLAASLLFYAWGSPATLIILLALIFATWIIGLAVTGRKKTRAGKLLVLAGVVVNVGALFVYKYLDFTLSNIGILFNREFTSLELELPLGLSFFCFQAISYVVDIYRGNNTARKNSLETALYLSLFFKITSGPIMQYNAFEWQLQGRRSSSGLLFDGLWRFAAGLGKKIIIATNIAYVTDRTFKLPEADLTITMAWLGSLAYMLQIYYDFSGYSDMAIGLGKMFGFEMPENFDYPYIATSVTNYWQRWHITLGNFFRDYMFYPLTLGPAVKLRKKVLKKHSKKTAKFVQNVFVTLLIWVTTGLWHGASWNYLIWGLVNFVFILWELYRKPLKNKHLDTAFGRGYTLMVSFFTKPLVRSGTLTRAAAYYGTMFGLNGAIFAVEKDIFYLKEYSFFLIIAVIGCFPWYKAVKERVSMSDNKKIITFMEAAEAVCLFAVLVLSPAYIQKNGTTAFIYQRF